EDFFRGTGGRLSGHGVVPYVSVGKNEWLDNGNTIFHFALKNSRMDGMNYIIFKFFSSWEVKNEN
ncbi:MAG: hypothetical protein J6T46_05090, partial [Victivallales bacterium]|nr:hypothetical protein [Victivallales bacterium]